MMKTSKVLLAGLVGALASVPDALSGSGSKLTIQDTAAKDLPPFMPALGVGGFKYQAVKGAFGRFRGSKRANRFHKARKEKGAAFASRVAVDERFKDRAGKIYVRCENGQMRQAFRKAGKVAFENCGVPYWA